MHAKLRLQRAEIMSSSAASPSSSPPTPPSPLPVSVGPGLHRYAFTPSPSLSPSPPFSPPETSPLLRVVRSEPRLRSAFSVDTFDRQPSCPPAPRRLFDLGACLEWVLMLVCCCCSSKMSKFEK